MMHRTKIVGKVATLISLLALIAGCGGSDSNDSQPESASERILLKSVTSETEFVSEVKTYYRSMLQQPKVYDEETDDLEILSDISFASDSSTDTVSTTNLIEHGVDEADVIKSDGENLYIVKQGRYEYSYMDDICSGELCASVVPEKYTEVKSDPSIRVMSLSNGEDPKAEEVASIPIPEISYIRGIYLVNDNQQIIIVGEGKKTKTKELGYSISTYIASYDVKDVENIEKQWEFEVEGSFKATRSMNDKLYLMSTNNFWINGIEFYAVDGRAKERNSALIDSLTIEDILPKAWLNDASFNAVAATDCINPEKINDQSIFDASLLSIFTIPLDTPGNMKVLCTLETSSEVYVSQNAIYTSKGEYEYKRESNKYTYSTVIHKLAFTEDSVEYRASTRLPGSTGWRSSDFRMSEQDGYLRVITSRYDQVVIESGTEIFIDPPLRNLSHHLYVLRENDEFKLEKVSKLPNSRYPKAIGKPGENIYAVRYFGDYAYVVTYRNIDPLYTINLSDHENPFIEGELEIPGYSDYLHPLSDNMLLGVGKETIVHNGTAWVQGVKVGLFDVGDKSAPMLIGDYTIGKRGSDTEVSRDYHAFSIISNRQTGVHKFAIPVRVHERRNNNYFLAEHMQWYGWSRSGLQLFEVDDGSVSTFPSLEHNGELVSHEYSGEQIYYHERNPRSVIVGGNDATLGGDSIHYIADGEVWSAKWDTPEESVGPQ